jgi:hypothetical protein
MSFITNAVWQPEAGHLLLFLKILQRLFKINQNKKKDSWKNQESSVLG